MYHRPMSFTGNQAIGDPATMCARLRFPEHDHCRHVGTDDSKLQSELIEMTEVVTFLELN